MANFMNIICDGWQGDPDSRKEKAFYLGMYFLCCVMAFAAASLIDKL